MLPRYRFVSQSLLAVLVSLALVASLAMAGGCSATDATLGSPSASPLAPPGDDTALEGSANPEADAGVAREIAYRGNPLCHVTVCMGVCQATPCMPDDDAQHPTAGVMACSSSVDGGDAGGAGNGCRIQGTGSSVAARCLPASTGGDGAECEQGEDCAAGFDCVVGNKGEKTCRHYCCSGTCKGNSSQSGGATFCDVQALADVPQKAPVCLPIKRCELLGSGECSAANETCAVVTESGDTGCVAIGGQQVGSSCDADHCAANLTCLGQPGTRRCFKLCSMASSDCGSMQVCETSAIFKDPSFGICQDP